MDLQLEHLQSFSNNRPGVPSRNLPKFLYDFCKEFFRYFSKIFFFRMPSFKIVAWIFSAFPPGILSEFLQKFLWSSFGVFCSVPMGILPEFLLNIFRSFFNISFGVLAGILLEVLKEFLQGSSKKYSGTPHSAYSFMILPAISPELLKLF